MLTIGVLALQGAFREHKKALQSLKYDNIKVIEVRLAPELRQCDALVIPGGESTSMRIIAQSSSLFEELHEFINVKKNPVWGTCAGCILLSEEIVQSPTDQSSAVGDESNSKKILGGIDIKTSRNFFGRQVHSFEAPLLCHASWSGKSFNAICIRAPAIIHVSNEVEVLGTIKVEREGGELKEIVAAAANSHVLVTIFHPELTEDRWIHKFFIERFVLGCERSRKEGRESRDH